MSDKPVVLMTSPYPDWDMEAMKRDYRLVPFWRLEDRPAILAEIGHEVRALASLGGRGADAALISALPKLEIIGHYGVGYDSVDVAAARARGVAVTNTPDVLTADVADLTMGLVLATLRRIPQADRFVRAGNWAHHSFPFTVNVHERRIGIVGFGRIGQAVARRAAAFDAEIGYFARSEKAEQPYRFFRDLRSMAEWADVLIVLVPGGEETRHIVSAAVIEALGPEGYLINVARGSVVDEAALLEALEQGHLAGAGLDVFESEPHIDPRFFALENVVLQPHVGSATEKSRRAMGQLVRDNLTAHFAGRPLLTPV